MKKIIAIIILLLILAIALFFIKDEDFMNRNDDKSVSLVSEENALVALDQIPSDQTIVSYAKLSQDGYIILFNASSTDAKNKKIDASKFLEKGEYVNVVIEHSDYKPLNKSTIKVVGVADDGDKQFKADLDINQLTKESEIVLHTDAKDLTQFKLEDIINVIKEAGYTVNPEVEAQVRNQQ